MEKGHKCINYTDIYQMYSSALPRRPHCAMETTECIANSIWLALENPE